jgi:LysM repeat protein
MKLPFRPPKKKTLQATTAAARRPREADFTEEPNVKLSSAFVVVLVLHIIAVGGIYAFHAINLHPATEDPDTSTQSAPAVQPAASPGDSEVAPAAPTTLAATATTPAVPLTYRVQSGDTISRIATAYSVSAEDLININDLRATKGIHVGQELKLPAGAIDPASKQTAQTTKPPVGLRDSGATYTVKSGDTPVSIAHKLHVVYDDLIKLNNIDDPRKLRIGMKLKVPMKRTAATA